jgi:hypothetical protein
MSTKIPLTHISTRITKEDLDRAIAISKREQRPVANVIRIAITNGLRYVWPEKRKEAR